MHPPLRRGVTLALVLAASIPLTLLAAPSEAASWGPFKDDGCRLPKLRQYSSQLHEISGDWMAACRATAATVGGQTFTRPSRCVDLGPGGMWGEFDVVDRSCPPTLEAFVDVPRCVRTGVAQYRTRVVQMPEVYQSDMDRFPKVVRNYNDRQYYDPVTPGQYLLTMRPSLKSDVEWHPPSFDEAARVFCEHLEARPVPLGPKLKPSRCEPPWERPFALFEVSDAGCAPIWGDFADKGCLPGKRVYTAPVTNHARIATGLDAVAQCRQATARFGRDHLNPVSCEATGGGVTATFHVSDSSCIVGWESYTPGVCNDTRRVFTARLANYADRINGDPLGLCRETIGRPVSPNMWGHTKPLSCELVNGVPQGRWEIDDPTCSDGPTYSRPLGPMPWERARAACESLPYDAGSTMKLCTSTQLCPRGTPIHGRPPGDVWIAAGDHANAWVSIGTKFDERLCRTHRSLFGDPAWGTTTGPEAVTGNPAAVLCCPPIERVQAEGGGDTQEAPGGGDGGDAPTSAPPPSP